jgi:thiamine monophosphate synthase
MLFLLGWTRIRGGPAGGDGGVTIGNAAEIASWGIDVIVSGSAIFDRVDPAGNLDLLSAQLRTPEEVSDGQR